MSASGPLILVVEDDEPTRRAVATHLGARGYRVDEAGSVAEALRRWEANRPDAILLDLGLPDVDGIQVVRHVRREATTPIVVLSARGEERDKVAALDAGADDYLTKPYGIAELQARIRVALRHAAGPAGDEQGLLTLGPIALDIARREVRVSGSPVELTPREYELLKVLLSYPGRVVTKGRLLRAVWGTAYAGEPHYLHVHVSHLRRKLAAADPAAGIDRLITAEPGIGYRVADV